MTTRFQGSGRTKEGGFLATHKQDHVAHVTGGDFRHTADHIDMNPSLGSFSHPNVQGTLELLANYASTVGTGFVSIGNSTDDGYGAGSYNVTQSVTFREALLSAFADDRLQNGGIILIISGTYRLNQTVDVPAGITIIGENASSIIIGDTSDTPMFSLKRGTDFPSLGGDEGSGDITPLIGAPTDEIKFVNLIIGDNIDGYVTAGPTMTTSPMIEMENAGRYVFENVKFLGQIADGAPSAVTPRDKTRRALGTVSGGSSGTFLTLKNCYFDGMETAAHFTPGNGNLDYLSVENCRARTFGTEAIAAADLSRNCFINMSLCNARLINNHHLGFGTFSTQLVGAMFVVSTVGGGSSDVDVAVIGNTGSPTSGMDSTAVYYAGAATGAANTNVKATITGNSWGSSIQNPWFVTVAEGSSIDDFVADFTGPGAIDLLLSAGLTYPTTVIVNPGTYTITTTDASGFSFIANQPRGDVRPIFDINVSGTTDEISNNVFLTGLKLEGIHFRSNSGASFSGVRPAGISGLGTHGVKVENCVFEDIGLSVDNTISGTENNFVDVINCRFEQTGIFSDDISLLLPVLDRVRLSGCLFTGYGYAGLIGDDISISYTNSKTEGEVILENCQFNQVGFTIDDASPLGEEAYLVVNNTDGSLDVKNCRWITSATYGGSAIASSARRAADFHSYLNWTAQEITIDGCLINAVDGAFDVSGTNRQIPGLQLIPIASLKMTSSRVLSSLCQIGNNTSALADVNAEGIYINGCQFHAELSTFAGQTLLDINLDPGTTPDHARIDIDNCCFQSFPVEDSAPLVPDHLASYTDYGIVQIFVDDIDVKFTNNNLQGDLVQPLPTGYTAASGLVVYNGVPSLDNHSQLMIDGNNMVVSNSISTGTATDLTAVTNVSCSNLIISDNFMNMQNNAAVSSSIISCLYVLTNQTGGGDDPARASIHGNTFSRFGGSQNLNFGYINIDGSSRPGSIHNNTFNATTVDGSNETLVELNASGWISFNNMNEIYTIVFNGEFGLFGASQQSSGEVVEAVVGTASSTASNVSVDITSLTTVLTGGYQDTGSRVVFKWAVPLHGILPMGATITEATVDVDVTSNPTTTSISRLTIRGVTADTINPLTTAGGTHTVSTARTIGSSSEYVELFFECNSSGTLNYFASPITIKYRL